MTAGAGKPAKIVVAADASEVQIVRAGSRTTIESPIRARPEAESV